MTTREREAALAALARDQRAHFTWQQANRCGFPDNTIAARLSLGVWEQRRQRVIAPAGTPTDWYTELASAVLWAGDGAAAARRSAAALHGLIAPLRHHHVVVPYRCCPVDADPDVVVHRSRHLTPDVVERIEGIDATVVPWTVGDLAIDHGYVLVRDVAARALRRKQATEDELHGQVPRLRGLRAATRMRAALDSLGPHVARARSDDEHRLCDAVVMYGLPTPVLNYSLIDKGGQFIAELDLAWPSLKLAVEIDEFEWHSDPSRKRRDDVRTNRLVLRGWRILRFTREDVRGRLPWVLRTIARAIATSPPEL